MFKSGASMIEHGKQTDRARQTDGTSGQNVCNLHETKPRPNLQGSFSPRITADLQIFASLKPHKSKSPPKARKKKRKSTPKAKRRESK